MSAKVSAPDHGANRYCRFGCDLRPALPPFRQTSEIRALQHLLHRHRAGPRQTPSRRRGSRPLAGRPGTGPRRSPPDRPRRHYPPGRRPPSSGSSAKMRRIRFQRGNGNQDYWLWASRRSAPFRSVLRRLKYMSGSTPAHPECGVGKLAGRRSWKNRGQTGEFSRIRPDQDRSSDPVYEISFYFKALETTRFALTKPYPHTMHH